MESLKNLSSMPMTGSVYQPLTLRWHQRLVVRALLLVLMLTSGILITFLWSNYQQGQNQRLVDFESNSEVTANIMAEALIMPMWNLDIEQVDKYLEALDVRKEYCGSEVHDETGKTIFVTRGNSEKLKAGFESYYEKPIQMAIAGDKEQLGILKLCMSKQLLADRDRIILWRSVLLYFIMQISLLFGVYAAFSILIRPLRKIETHLAQSGDALRPIQQEDLLAINEIGQLTYSFNHMMQNLSVSQNQMLAAKEKAEAANQAKTEFLSNMSHELRTPMHAILNYADLGLKKLGEAGDEKLQKYFFNIQQSGERLLRLLNSLLDLSKLEAGKMLMHVADKDLCGIVKRALMELDSLLQAKQLKTSLESEVAIPRAWVDEERMMQVLVNLLSNAIKFSPEQATITIQIGLEIDSNNLAYWVIRIADDGVGVPKAELESIFEKFTQSSVTNTGAGGTGLGLPICREIVEAHYGKIWAEQRPGGGSVFIVRLPKDRRAARNVAIISEESARGA